MINVKKTVESRTLDFSKIKSETISGMDGYSVVKISSEYESDVTEIFNWLVARNLPAEKLMIDFGTEKKGKYYVWDSQGKKVKRIDGRSKEMAIFKGVLVISGISGIPMIQETLKDALRRLIPKPEHITHDTMKTLWKQIKKKESDDKK